MYYILALVWHGLYTAFDIDNQNRNLFRRMSDVNNINDINYQENKFNWDQLTLKGCFKHYSKFKKSIMIILSLIYPVQITFSYFRGVRSVPSSTLNYVLLVIFCLLFFLIMIFFYYTCRFKCALSRSYEIPGKVQHKHINKLLTKSNLNI